MATLPSAQTMHQPQPATLTAAGMGLEQPATVSAREAADAGRCARVIRAVRNERSRGRRRELDLLWMCVVGVVAGMRLQSGLGLDELFSIPEALALSACGVLIIVLSMFRRFRYRAAMAGLLRDNQKQNLHVLIELTPYIRGKQAAEAKARLTSILLSVNAADRVFTRSDVTRLHAMLCWPDVALVCAILHAIETVGTLESLPAVTRLAKGKLLARNVPAVKQTAILCMEALKDQMSEPRSIGLLLSLMRRPDVHAHLKHEARQSLIIMLSRLTAGDRHYFKGEERRLLYEILATRDIEFILAILKMTPRVGLLDALPFVDALAAGKYVAGRNHSLVREQARICKQLLGGRLNVLDSRNTLLRSSAASPTTREELVRALNGFCRIEESELLRSGSGRTSGKM